MMDEHLQPKKLQEEAAEGYWHPKVWEPLCFVKGPRGFPGGSDSKESTCDAGNLCLIPGSGRFPQRREWQPTPVFLPREFHGQRIHGVVKSQT